MTTMAIAAAKERQLDWLLAEVLGGSRIGARRSRPLVMPWLAAAIALLAVGAAVGVAWLRSQETAATTQQPAPAIPWHECHGPGELDRVPAATTALKAFDFDDAACRQLARFPRLEHVDLSGMDLDDRGYAVALKITDDGVRALGALPNLRWLSLAGCHDTKGEGLRALEALPRLEHLDLTYSGVESPAIERLPRLPSLRTLVLSHCMNFHGRSLAAVASMPGLRRLELRACTTLAAKDVRLLAQSKELRHLDLRDCQGHFRGQTASGFSTGGEEPPPPPVQDGIGITDDVVAALAVLPLESLLLGGSESLTDAIAEPIAAMATLRALDLSNLPKTTGALLAKLPATLTSLALDHNPQFGADAFAALPQLPQLTELGLSGLGLDGARLRRLLDGKRLTVLRLGGQSARGKGDRPAPPDASPTAADAAIVAGLRELETLDLSHALWIDAEVMRHVATLPRLTSLDLSGTPIGQADQLAPLAKVASLRRLVLTWCRHLDDHELDALAGSSLRQLDVYGTNLQADVVKAAAKALPGCVVVLPKGRTFRVP